MNETEWQTQLLQLAHTLGWKHLHVRRSRGRGGRGAGWITATNQVGWPDLLLWRPGCMLVALELKVPPNKASDEQLEVLAELSATGHVHAQVAYPSDLDALVPIFQHGPTPTRP